MGLALKRTKWDSWLWVYIKLESAWTSCQLLKLFGWVTDQQLAMFQWWTESQITQFFKLWFLFFSRLLTISTLIYNYSCLQTPLLPSFPSLYTPIPRPTSISSFNVLHKSHRNNHQTSDRPTSKRVRTSMLTVRKRYFLAEEETKETHIYTGDFHYQWFIAVTLMIHDFQLYFSTWVLLKGLCNLTTEETFRTCYREKERTNTTESSILPLSLC